MWDRRWRETSGGILCAVAALAIGTAALAVPAAASPRQADSPSPAPDSMGDDCRSIHSLEPTRALSVSDGVVAASTDPTEAEPLRLQATDLSHYLLVDREGRYVTAQSDGLALAAAPSAAAVWRVERLGEALSLHSPATDKALVADPGGAFTAADGNPEGDAARFELRPASGCVTLPEAEINVSGPHLTGPGPDGEVIGYLDGHLHITGYESLGGMIHCGAPWHPYGVTYALVDCPDHEIADGSAAVLENFLSDGSPVGNHDSVGWPTFRDWPAPSSLTHEQTYYRWVERSWRGGVRVIVNLLVENRVICELYPLQRTSCDPMASIRAQAQRIREMERYIDAQNGGAGKGWFRIVETPSEARAVANRGDLAVILGIEVSEPFGCRVLLAQPLCSVADIDTELDDLYELGIRQITPVHKFDNALGGVAGDGGTKGTVINIGNLASTGEFWDFETCDTHDHGVHDNAQEVLPDTAEQTEFVGDILSEVSPVALPVYPPAPHCNTKGLTDLGAHTLEAMQERGMIIDLDHMSVRTRQDSLDLIEASGYPGVVSSHSWATPDAYPRIYDLGGMTSPYAGSSTSFVGAWRERRAAAGEPDDFALGFGADANGLGAQGGPRGADAENPVEYPFTGLGGVVIDRQVTGERVFDINVDGVAHYGLYPDWIEDLRRQAGDQIVEDLARGAEAYLQVWEAAIAASESPSVADAPSVDPQRPDTPLDDGGPASLPTTGGSGIPPVALSAMFAGAVLLWRRGRTSRAGSASGSL